MKIISIKKPKGFTLIEMLVVVLIIGVLAAVALPQYTKSVERSRAAEPQTILKSMFNAQQECILRMGDWDKCVAPGYNDNSSNFWNASSFEPPSELTDNCLDTAPCFKTEYWEYWVDDYLYAGRVKNNEIIATLYLGVWDTDTISDITCANWTEEDYCQKIGMESN